MPRTSTKLHKLVPLLIGNEFTSGNGKVNFQRQRIHFWNSHWGSAQPISWYRGSYLPDLFKKPVVFPVTSFWVSSDWRQICWLISQTFWEGPRASLCKVNPVRLPAYVSQTHPHGGERAHMAENAPNPVKPDRFREKFQSSYQGANSACVCKDSYYRKATLLVLGASLVASLCERWMPAKGECWCTPKKSHCAVTPCPWQMTAM